MAKYLNKCRIIIPPDDFLAKATSHALPDRRSREADRRYVRDHNQQQDFLQEGVVHSSAGCITSPDL